MHIVFTLYAFVIGTCIGSFLNVVIHRLPKMTYRSNITEKYNLSVPPSHCPACNHKIRWYENIPLLSWVLLKAKCSSCKSPIHWRYPFLELISGLGAATLFGWRGASLENIFWIPLWFASLPLLWWFFSKTSPWSRPMKNLLLLYSMVILVGVATVIKQA